MKKYNHYMVSWQDRDCADYCKLIKIINRPNPDDETIIKDYMYKNYSNIINSFGLSIDFMDEIIIIDEDFCIETVK